MPIKREVLETVRLKTNMDAIFGNMILKHCKLQ